MGKYDLIVVGGGTAGLVAAAGSAGLGARVALIERERLGGECLWTGCVPSKALIATARAAVEARGGYRFGIAAHEGRTDFRCVMQWVGQAQQRIAPHDSPERFRGLGVDVIHDDARFVGERALAVNGHTLTAKRIVIATGSSPAVPPIEGLNTVPYLTNETIFSIAEQPRTLLVIGGGAIGLELAQAFARLGTTVHVLEAESQLLSREDAELVSMLVEQLRAEGVQLHVGTKVERIEHANHGEGVRLTATNAATGVLELEGEALLVATGRSPRIASLELNKAGVDVRKDGLVVGESLQTTAEGVWAAGDCVGPLRFTHVADYQARLVIRNAFFPFSSKADYSVVPWVTFTEPELAHVGLTEQEARERFGDGVRIWQRRFEDVDRAITDGQTAGMVKLITTARGRILGGHILGHGAGNMIGEITLAMKHGISAHALGSTIHPYPTYAEAIKQAAESYTRSKFTGIARRIVNWYVRR